MQDIQARSTVDHQTIEALQAQLHETRQRLAFYQEAGASFQRRLDDIVEGAVRAVEQVDVERRELEREVEHLRGELATLQQSYDQSRAQTQEILHRAHDEARQLVEEARSRSVEAIRLALQELNQPPAANVTPFAYAAHHAVSPAPAAEAVAAEPVQAEARWAPAVEAEAAEPVQAEDVWAPAEAPVVDAMDPASAADELDRGELVAAEDESDRGEPVAAEDESARVERVAAEDESDRVVEFDGMFTRDFGFVTSDAPPVPSGADVVYGGEEETLKGESTGDHTLVGRGGFVIQPARSDESATFVAPDAASLEPVTAATVSAPGTAAPVTAAAGTAEAGTAAPDEGVLFESITRLHIHSTVGSQVDQLVKALDQQFGAGSVAVANREPDESDLLVTHPHGTSLLRALLSVKGLDFRPVGRGDGFLEIEIRAA